MIAEIVNIQYFIKQKPVLLLHTRFTDRFAGVISLAFYTPDIYQIETRYSILVTLNGRGSNSNNSTDYDVKNSLSIKGLSEIIFFIEMSSWFVTSIGFMQIVHIRLLKHV